MPKYVDGYVLPIPTKNVAAYQKIAKRASKIWMEHGALQYCESVGEDLSGDTPMVSFLKPSKAKPDETVIFAWVVFKSRAHRDKVNEKVMKDPRLAAMMDPKAMPFDFKKMIYGGFNVIVDG